MKKILFLLFLPIFTKAQTDSSHSLVSSDTQTVEKYCEIVATAKLLSNKVSISVDFGQESSIWTSQQIKNEGGKVQYFNSVVDALNYMAGLGWKLQTALLLGSGPYVYHYVFKKEFKKIPN